MYIPSSTYRIQFNKDYTFKKFIDNIEYFTLLGINTIYASPIFKAVPGSNHGYDVVDPNCINPEIGTETEFDQIITTLKTKNIGWIQDIVPNHTAFHEENTWLMDVLKFGKHSKFYNFFDIDFSHPHFGEKLMIPILNKTLETTILQNEIYVTCKQKDFIFKYLDHTFPINNETLTQFISDINLSLILPADTKDFECQKTIILQILDSINQNTSKLFELLKIQNYILCQWEETDKHLNYRRFFTVNSLICIKMENEEVFMICHNYINHLIKNRKINGLRIDHIDGLKDPTQYLNRLRKFTGKDTYIVSEKILQNKEELKKNWPIQGTTGYDFLAQVNNLLTFKKNYYKLNKYYQDITGTVKHPSEISYQKKKLILNQNLQGDLDNLYRQFDNAGFVTYGIDGEITPEIIKEAIGEFILACPCYRLYSNTFPLSHEDENIVKSMIHQAIARNPLLKKALEILQSIFLDHNILSVNKKEEIIKFFLRCMQFTGPIMAKGIEDTIMFDYNIFIAHNEVGDSTSSSGISIMDFHEAMKIRQKNTPMTMNATATHDTKRGEDARARLNVLSEVADEWIIQTDHWFKINKIFKTQFESKDAPNTNEEYFIYQTLIGIYPLNNNDLQNLPIRINKYIVKALREAKINSNWNHPNEVYEKIIIEFIRKIIAPESSFFSSFLIFLQKIVPFGIANSLTQLLLKTTCPGIPDFYQGTELWDLTLVDPDNRNLVDYKLRNQMLKFLIQEHEENPSIFYKNLYSNLLNEQLKMWYTYILLKERNQNSEIFISGQYIPLTVIGKYKKNILAFARTDLKIWYVIIAPLYTTYLKNLTNNKEIDWQQTYLILPDNAPEKWHLYPEEKTFYCKDNISLSEIMKLSIGVFLKATKEN